MPMPDDEKLSPEELARRRQWFDEYCRQLDEASVVRGPEPGRRFPCPISPASTMRRASRNRRHVSSPRQAYHPDGQEGVLVRDIKVEEATGLIHGETRSGGSRAAASAWGEV